MELSLPGEQQQNESLFSQSAILQILGLLTSPIPPTTYPLSHLHISCSYKVPGSLFLQDSVYFTIYFSEGINLLLTFTSPVVSIVPTFHIVNVQ